MTEIGPAAGRYFMSCCIAQVWCSKLASGWLPGLAGRIKEAVKAICDAWEETHPGEPKPWFCEKLDEVSPERLCDLINLVCPKAELE